MTWIQNVSLSDIQHGFHFAPGWNSMLIQIVDPDMEFPKPLHEFRQMHQFKFLDLEQDDCPEAEKFKITDAQAAELVGLLQHALANNMNVVVHCHAGVCRSGAVVDVGIMMGFQEPEVFRSPNLLVKRKMMEALEFAPDAIDLACKPSCTESGITTPIMEIKVDK